MGSPIKECRYCGSEALVFVPCPSSPGQNRIVCRACDRQLGLTPKPMTPERAAAFVVPIGEYRGKTFAEVYEINPDRVRWFATGYPKEDAIQRAAKAFLEFQEPRP